ncbi:hypothetical protein FHW04_001564 [Pantoea sp. AN62]|jgi:hypothetical protein
MSRKGSEQQVSQIPTSVLTESGSTGLSQPFAVSRRHPVENVTF